MPTLSQDIIPGGTSVEWALFATVDDFSRKVEEFLRRTKDASFIGVDIHLCADGTVDAMALAANDYAVVVMNSSASFTSGTRRGKALSQTGPFGRLLRGEFNHLAGFAMPRLILHMKDAFGVHIKGFDIGSSIPAKKTLSPGQLLKETLYWTADSHALDTLWDASPLEQDDNPDRFSSLILRAHFASKISESQRNHILSGGELDTMWLHDKFFEGIYKMVREEAQIDATKPRQSQGEFTDVTHTKMGDMVITNERYKTRVRPSNTTRIIIQDEHENEFIGRADGMHGRKTNIKFLGNVGRGKITKMKVVGKEERTVAEKARDAFLLLVLQGKRDLIDPIFPLIKLLWFPDETSQALVQKQGTSGQMSEIRGEQLNGSQATVVDAMVYSPSRFVIVHGPPGTGKTSTISAAVKRWSHSSGWAWLVAQSNVGVKNIAERLCKDKIPFRLIVSKDFYFEWHEEIYEDSIKEQLVRTDEIPQNPRDVALLFHDVRVVLCTLSTLSNPVLTEKKIFYHVPMVNLVVDEASQIGIFDYLHLFGQFKSLAKVCFFGDPKQLPPHGQEAAVTMQSIFDVQHLKPHAYFLNTQYRMPEPLGNFISDAVYDSKLKSVHAVRSPSCVAFVDASLGKEEGKGTSYKNSREAQSIVHLVREYYTGKNYCIITPYDGQRGLLQDELKREGLRWDNVYNVDSFQGNEADYILISVVRTEAPGFLRSKQRVNVMLTRCKKGMVIVCNRTFMHRTNVLRKTVLGGLCEYWETNYGADATWRGWKEVMAGKASLPGSVTSAVDEGVETRPKVKPPQLTLSAKSFLGKEVNGHASSRARHAVRHAHSHGGDTSSSSRTPSSPSTSSSSVAISKTRSTRGSSLGGNGRIFNANQDFPLLRTSSSVRSGKGGWAGGSFSKAHLKPSVKMNGSDLLINQLADLKVSVKAKDSKASRKPKSKK